VRDWCLAHEALARLSLWLHERGGESWSPDVVEDGVWQVRSEPDAAGRVAFDVRVTKTWAPMPGQHESEQRLLLADLASNAGVLGPLDVQTPNWRYLHRSLREFLVAERLAELGAEAWQPRIEVWAKAVEAADGDEEQQKAHAPWAEVFALLVGCVSADQRLQVLKAIRSVSPPLARRALGNADGLPVADGVAFAMADPKVDGDDLLRWFRAWGVEGVEAARLLMPHVGEGTAVDRLGSIWFVLEELGVKLVREAFFAQAGRPVEAAVQVPWVEIPAGTFLMGSPEGEEERFDFEGPQHEVRVPAFRLSRTPVTDAEYRRFEQDHPRRESGRRPKGSKGSEAPAAGQEPVVDVSWWAAYAYCRWVGGELPSEAQWEYACRAGTTTRFWSGDGEEDLERVGWYGGNSKRRAQPVGTKPANAFGLCDVHGNVWEWCQDRWHGNYQGAPTDGSAWVEGGSGSRALRGGSWFDSAGWCRSAARLRWHVGSRLGHVGFRPSSSSPDPFTPSPPVSSDPTRADQPEPGHAPSSAAPRPARASKHTP
jgi:formylglycine-generating enzyme required for sulfatase activity